MATRQVMARIIAYMGAEVVGSYVSVKDLLYIVKLCLAGTVFILLAVEIFALWIGLKTPVRKIISLFSIPVKSRFLEDIKNLPEPTFIYSRNGRHTDSRDRPLRQAVPQYQGSRNDELRGLLSSPLGMPHNTDVRPSESRVHYQAGVTLEGDINSASGGRLGGVSTSEVMPNGDLSVGELTDFGSFQTACDEETISRTADFSSATLPSSDQDAEQRFKSTHKGDSHISLDKCTVHVDVQTQGMAQTATHVREETVPLDIDLNILATLNNPSTDEGENLSLHRKSTFVPAYLFNLPLCDEMRVPGARRLSASMYASRLTSIDSMDRILDSHILSVTSERRDLRSAIGSLASAAPLSTPSITSRQASFFPGVPLPPHKRTPRALFSPFVSGSMDPVILTHTIDISLTKYCHPLDAEWDSFETDHRSGTLPNNVLTFSRQKSTHLNDFLALADGYIDVLSQPDYRLSHRISHSSTPKCGLPLERRAIQRPEVYYATPERTIIVPMPSLSTRSITTHGLSRKAQSIECLAVANRIAEGRRKTMTTSMIPFAVDTNKPTPMLDPTSAARPKTYIEKLLARADEQLRTARIVSPHVVGGAGDKELASNSASRLPFVTAAATGQIAKPA